MRRAPAAALLLGAALLAAPRAAPAQASPFAFTEADGRLALAEAGRPVLVYNYGMQLPEGVPERYRRSSYVHPLYDLSGRVLTDDFPRDHYHHRGLSWMWPSVLAGGREYDLWHVNGMRQQFEGWLGREAGADAATFGVRNAWRTADRKVLDEEVRFRVHRAGPRGRAIDVQLTLTALEPVRIVGTKEGNKGYGGFVLRFAPRQETVITTPQGVQPADSDHLHLPWADESGKFGGASETSGISIFEHAGNPGHPSAWTLRQYGFVGNAWPGMEGFSLEPGRPVTLRYRVWVHRGDAAEGAVAEAFAEYRNRPPAPLRE